jgi:hypothetical protein
MHFISKFWHGHEDNTLSFSFYQSDDSRNEFSFDLDFSSAGNTITFNPSGSFASDGAFTIFTSFTAGDGYKEYILSMAILNRTISHDVTDSDQDNVSVKLTLAD